MLIFFTRTPVRKRSQNRSETALAVRGKGEALSPWLWAGLQELVYELGVRGEREIVRERALYELIVAASSEAVIISWRV